MHFREFTADLDKDPYSKSVILTTEPEMQILLAKFGSKLKDPRPTGRLAEIDMDPPDLYEVWTRIYGRRDDGKPWIEHVHGELGLSRIPSFLCKPPNAGDSPDEEVLSREQIIERLDELKIGYSSKESTERLMAKLKAA